MTTTTAATLRPRDFAVARFDIDEIQHMANDYSIIELNWTYREHIIDAAKFLGYKVATHARKVPGCVTMMRDENEFGWYNEHAWFTLRIDADGLITICDFNGNAV